MSIRFYTSCEELRHAFRELVLHHYLLNSAFADLGHCNVAWILAKQSESGGSPQGWLTNTVALTRSQGWVSDSEVAALHVNTGNMATSATPRRRPGASVTGTAIASSAKCQKVENYCWASADACSTVVSAAAGRVAPVEDESSEQRSDGVLLSTADVDDGAKGELPSAQLPVWESVLRIEADLVAALKVLPFGESVTHVYFPTEYACEPHANFTRRYCRGKKRILFLGMNPGPFGMVQTGVPFGDAPTVKGWFKIAGRVGQPPSVHPKRPILGLDCLRQEVSGSRFWGYFQKLGPPDMFFSNCFVYNMCPAAFMSHSGRNVIPSQLRAAEQRVLNELCQRSLASLLELLEIEMVIAIGQFAYKGAQKAVALSSSAGKVKVECILHPSPRNPRANKGWWAIVTEQFQKMGVAGCLGITAKAAAYFASMQAGAEATDDAGDDA